MKPNEECCVWTCERGREAAAPGICWNIDAHDSPGFSDLIREIEGLLEWPGRRIPSASSELARAWRGLSTLLLENLNVRRCSRSRCSRELVRTIIRCGSIQDAGAIGTLIEPNFSAIGPRLF